SVRGCEAKRNAVWALTRIDGEAARAGVRQALSDADPTVRQAALNSISLWRDREAAPLLLSSLSRGAAMDRRLAAEALGRIGDKSAVPPLLVQLADTTDEVLRHSLTFALIEIADRDSSAKGITSANPRVRRAALT